ncbi:MAG: hypothetical protein C4527_26345 [Candidatus Omnitrophota bacterium]|jgi:hypothetical protein|nr:MAG: hypothetical protein C4527_26345 [Candidatus Omnitrophota bacterium]
MEEYRFTCPRCRCNIEAEAPIPARNLHLLLGLATLGIWLVVYSFLRLFQLYQLSLCETCGKHSRKLLALLLILILGTAEITWLIYYFLEVAPPKIVFDASMAELPGNLDLNSDVSKDNAWQLFTFVWLVSILPGVGAMIAANWPYILLFWFTIVVLIGLSVPSFYLRR